MTKQFVSFERLLQYDILIKEFINKLIVATDGDVAKLSSTLDILTGNTTPEKSIQEQINDAINKFEQETTEDGSINKFKELVDYVNENAAPFATALENISALQTAVGTPASEDKEATGLYKAIEEAIEKSNLEFETAIASAKEELEEAIEDSAKNVLNTGINTNSGEDGDIVAYLGGTVGDPTIALKYEFCTEVDVRKLFAVPYVTEIGGENGATLADAISVLSSNEDIFEAQLTLQDETSVATSLNIPAGKSVTIDLNGQSLTNAEGTSPAQLLNVIGELTITDSAARGRAISTSSIVNTANNKVAVKLANANAVLNVEGGLIESTTGTSSKAISCVNGTVNMSGGKVISSGTGIDGKNINISGGEVIAEGIAVSGSGTISGGNITSNTSYGVYANSSNSEFVITGGNITGNETKGAVGIYTGNVYVSKDAELNTPIAFASNASGIILAGSAAVPEVADLEIYNNGELKGYFTSKTTNTSCSAMNGATVKLTKDINTMYNVIGYDVTLDLNGHNITSADTAAITVKAGSSASKVRNVVITGEGNVSCDNGAGCVAVYVDRYTNVIIENGNYSVGGDIDNAVVYIANSYKTAPTVVEVNGGTFTSGDGKWILNIKDELRGSENPDDNAKFIVTGGTFVGFDPSDCISEGEGTNFVAEGFECYSVEGSNVFEVKPQV